VTGTPGEWWIWKGEGGRAGADLKSPCTDKKENQIFLIYKEIQSGAVAKSYMTNGLLIYGEIFAHFSCIKMPFLIFAVATAPI
jgi:hypothetical protein